MAQLMTSLGDMTAQTQQMFRDATRGAIGVNGTPEMVKRGITQATGFVWYDLAAPAKNLFPVITPFRNKLPRVPGNGDTATRWKAVTAINAAGLRGAVPEGKRNGTVSTTVVDRLRAYKTIGLEEGVTFEAVNASRNFEDIRSTMAQRLLWATMIAEEQFIVGGNGDTGIALGTTPLPVVANAASGGAIAAATYSVICVALTHAGWQAANLTNGLPDVQTVTDPQGASFTYNPGTAIKSSAASTTTSGATSTITATVAVVNGAMAYAWYVGASGAEKLQAITGNNTVTLTALSTTTQACAGLFTVDRSQNAIEFDGFLTQGLQAGSGATINQLPTNQKLTCANGDASIDQFEYVLRKMWDDKKVSPNVVYVSSQELATISSLVVKNNGAPIVRLNGDFGNGVDAITAGSVVGSYLNRYGLNGSQLVKIQLHPYLPPGTCLFHADNLPFPVSGVPNVAEIHVRQDYYQIDWPIVSREYRAGVYSDETLAHYYPGAMGLITNIAP